MADSGAVVLDRRKFLLGAAAAVAIGSAGVPAGAQVLSRGVDSGRQPLARGLSASFWFEWVPSENSEVMKNHIETWYQPDDFAKMRSLGFDHIRVSLQPEFLAPKLGTGDADLNEERLALFDNAMAGILKNDLKVVLDNHATSPQKDKLSANDSYRSAMGQWWRNFSRHIVTHGQYNTEQTFFELLNEPEASFADIEKYRTMIGKFISDVRASSPNHTIIVGGNNWNVPEAIFSGLQTPFPDQNLIYSFHFYNPLDFTHQGLVNAGPYYAKLKNVPWGVGPSALKESAISDYDPSVQEGMRQYNQASHKKADLAWAFTELRKWCDGHGQRAWLGEFGVYSKVAPAEDRAAWVRDVRELAEENGFGWAMWEARGGFGLFESPNDSRPLQVNLPLLHSLGL